MPASVLRIGGGPIKSARRRIGNGATAWNSKPGICEHPKTLQQRDLTGAAIQKWFSRDALDSGRVSWSRAAIMFPALVPAFLMRPKFSARFQNWK
ncbi:hypothetical protein [Streptosporangium sp. LJ11]|uniref:hypothetical protein n=1 Tax=Streptosporangium sp. LJ11 TaxID=3436927 RepID=UPI003F7993C5